MEAPIEKALNGKTDSELIQRLFIQVKKLTDEISDLKNKTDVAKESIPSVDILPMGSIEKKDIFAALAKAQLEYERIDCDKIGHFKNKYPSLDSVIWACRPSLSKNGLGFTQPPDVVLADGSRILFSILFHSSGQWIGGKNRMNPKGADDLSYGANLSLIRRYSAMSLLGFTFANDPDDNETKAKEYENNNRR